MFQVPIIENGECQEMIHKLGYTKLILPSTLCAGYAEGGKDSCEVRYDQNLLHNPIN